MKLIEIEDLLIKNCINVRNSFISVEFVKANLKICRSICRDVLYENNVKFIPIEYEFRFSVFLAMLYLFCFSFNLFIGLNLLISHLISSAIVLTLNFFTSGRFKNFICRFLIKEVFKVKVNCCKISGFDFVLIGSSDDCNVVYVRTINKGPSGDDRKLYLIHRDFLYVALFDYLNGGKNSLDLNKLNYKVYSALTLEVDTLEYLVSK